MARPRQLSKQVTPEEIVAQIARMSDPFKSSEAWDSEQTLASLIRECRATLAPGRHRQRAQVFTHQSREFTTAMLRIEAASGGELREFVRDVVDLLWGEGDVRSKHQPRRLNVEKEWDVETIEELALALSRRGFYSPSY